MLFPLREITVFFRSDTPNLKIATSPIPKLLMQHLSSCCPARDHKPFVKCLKPLALGCKSGIMSRNESTPWAENRSIFLKIGFIFSISLVLLAFNYSVMPESSMTFAEEDYTLDKEIEIIRTNQEPPKAPPPPAPIPSDPILAPTPPMPEPIIDPILKIPEPIGLLPNPPPGDGSQVVPPKPLPLPEAPPAEKGPWIMVEVMPRFSGCEDIDGKRADKEICATKALLEFMRDNIDYPSTAKEVGIEGTVVVRFIVEKDGSISNTEIIRDIGGGCGREAIRVVKLMPDWIPGMQQGRKVRVQFNLPVRFQLGR